MQGRNRLQGKSLPIIVPLTVFAVLSLASFTRAQTQAMTPPAKTKAPSQVQTLTPPVIDGNLGDMIAFSQEVSSQGFSCGLVISDGAEDIAVVSWVFVKSIWVSISRPAHRS